MREKFGFPSAGEMRRGNGRSHHEDAENATKETKRVQASSNGYEQHSRFTEVAAERQHEFAFAICIERDSGIDECQREPVAERASGEECNIIIDHEYTDETERGENGIDADERSY